MGSATREHRLAAIAALLGVGAAMCNREQEPSALPVQAREVPPTAPDPAMSLVASSDAAVQRDDVLDAGIAIVDAASVVATADSAPPPPPPKATSLAAFDRFAPPLPRPPGPSPPAPPPQHCCSTNPSCGVKSCNDANLNTSTPPFLTYSATIGLRPKVGLDREVVARARLWIGHARMLVGACGSILPDPKVMGQLTVEAHAGDGGAGVVFSVTSSMPSSFRECVAQRLGTIANRLAIDGPPSKLAFVITVSQVWVNLGASNPGNP